MRLTCRLVLAVSILSAGFVMPARAVQGGGAPAKTTSPSVAIGILPFQDASGGDYGESLARILAKQLQAALLNASRHTPRFLKPGEGLEDVEQMDLDSAVKLARSHKMNFVVLGSLLSVQVDEGETGFNAPTVGGVTLGGQGRRQAAEVVLQVELIDVERGERVASLRVTGNERDTRVAANVYTDYGSMDMGGAAFQNTVLGKAAQKAIDEVVKQMLPKLQTSAAAEETGVSGKATAAFSDTKPIDANATAERRANNGRVEFARIEP